MAGSVNRVMIIGNVGGDPKVHVFPDGNRSVTFSVATSDRWKDRQSGEPRERTEWHKVVVQNTKLGEIAESYIRKGSKVYIEGENRTRKYTKDNVEFQTTEVVLPMFRGAITLLDSAGGGSAAAASPDAPPATGGSGVAPRGGISDIDDSIPFAAFDEIYIGAERFGKNRTVF